MNISRKRIAKVLVAMFAGTLIIALAGYLLWSRPLEFERTYLANKALLETPNLNALATARRFYLGASTNSASQLPTSNFNRTFNSSTPENLLKLGNLLHLPKAGQDFSHARYDFSAADQWLEVAVQQGVRVRGHTLIWGRLSDDYQAPDIQPWIDTFPNEAVKKQMLTHLLKNHITTVLERYRGKISQWDVVNEPLELMGQGELDENIFTRYLGDDYIAMALQHAHKTDPSLKLYVNEQLHNYTGAKAQAFYKRVATLIQKGVPLHGIGLQHHMLFHLENTESTTAYMEQFAALGLEVEITELDARLRLFKDHHDPYQAQGNYYAEIVAACLQLTACRGVTFWGLNDAHAWHDELGYMFPKPNEPYLFDANHKAKPGIWAIGEVLR